MRLSFWDRTGFCIIAKRLAQGRFHLGIPADETSSHVELEAAELAAKECDQLHPRVAMRCSLAFGGLATE